MADSANRSLVSVKILVEGSPINEEYDVMQIKVFRSVNRISSATVKLIDGSASKETFSLSEKDEVVPGKKIEIQTGFGLKTKSIFKGVITGQRIKASGRKGGILTLECRDQTAKMTVGSNSQAFVDKKDSDILSQVIGDHGLSADIAATSTTFPQIVQYDASDWDFILSRAEINGFITLSEDDKITQKKPQDSGPVATLTYGKDIVEFDAQIDSRTQLGAISAHAWDYTAQAPVEQTASPPSVPDTGNLTGKKLSEVTAPANFILQSTSALETGELKSWADGRLLKSRLAKVRGEIKVFGSEKLAPDTLVTLAGMGKRFNGDVYVSEVIHEIEEGNWWTTIVLGIDPNWFAKQIDITAPSASGVLPGTRGLQNGVVKKIIEDPKGETRVQVEVPMFKTSSSEGLIWARWAQPYATAGAGQFFMPEIDDEVVLGFLNQDPRYPVILGSLYSSGRAPAYTPAEGNPIKAIVTNSQLKIEFNDEKKIMSLLTPGGHKIILSDEEKTMSLITAEGHQIILSDEEKTITTTTTDGHKILMSDQDKHITTSTTGGHKILMSDEDKNITATTTGGHKILMSDQDKHITTSTTGGQKVAMDDQGKTMTLSTPGGQKVVLDDQGKGINMQDSNGNKVSLGSAGITLKSPANINIEATGNLSIKGTAGVKVDTPAQAAISAQAALNMKAANVSISGDAVFSAKGGAQASVSAGGQLALKGALVMIN